MLCVSFEYINSTYLNFGSCITETIRPFRVGVDARQALPRSSVQSADDDADSFIALRLKTINAPAKIFSHAIF